MTSATKKAFLPTLSKETWLEGSGFDPDAYAFPTSSIEEAAVHLCVSVEEVMATSCQPGAVLVNYQEAINKPFTFRQRAAKWHGSQRGAYQWREDADEYLPAARLYSNGWVLSAVGYQEGTGFPVRH